jgi:hypothetical protein
MKSRKHIRSGILRAIDFLVAVKIRAYESFRKRLYFIAALRRILREMFIYFLEEVTSFKGDE